jgi:hypothetical protein
MAPLECIFCGVEYQVLYGVPNFLLPNYLPKDTSQEITPFTLRHTRFTISAIDMLARPIGAVTTLESDVGTYPVEPYLQRG